MSIQGLLREPKFLVTFILVSLFPVLGVEFSFLGSYLVFWNLRELYRADLSTTVVILIAYALVQIGFLAFMLARNSGGDTFNSFLVAQTAAASLVGMLAFFFLFQTFGLGFFFASGLSILLHAAVLLAFQWGGLWLFQFDFLATLTKKLLTDNKVIQETLVKMGKGGQTEALKSALSFAASFLPVMLLLSQAIIFHLASRIYFFFYSGHPVIQSTQLRFLRLPKFFIWTVIVGWALILLMRWVPSLASVKVPISNLLALAGFLYFAQGLGILSHFLASFQRGFIPHLIAIAVVGVIFFFQPGLLVILFTVTVGFGLGDQWFNYRRLQ